MSDKPGHGQSPATGPFNARVWSRVVDAADAYHEQQARGVAPPPSKNGRPWHTIVQVKNKSTGHADLRRGDIVELDGGCLDEFSNDYLWFDGVTPDPTQKRAFGVLLRPQPYESDESAVGPALTVGVCVAYVTITDDAHGYAQPAAGTHVLESVAGGPVKILDRESGTGEKLCLVMLGPAQTSYYPASPRHQFFNSDGLAIKLVKHNTSKLLPVGSYSLVPTNGGFVTLVPNGSNGYCHHDGSVISGDDAAGDLFIRSPGFYRIRFGAVVKPHVYNATYALYYETPPAGVDHNYREADVTGGVTLGGTTGAASAGTAHTHSIPNLSLSTGSPPKVFVYEPMRFAIELVMGWDPADAPYSLGSDYTSIMQINDSVPTYQESPFGNVAATRERTVYFRFAPGPSDLPYCRVNLGFSCWAPGPLPDVSDASAAYLELLQWWAHVEPIGDADGKAGTGFDPYLNDPTGINWWGANPQPVEIDDFGAP